MLIVLIMGIFTLMKLILNLGGDNTIKKLLIYKIAP